MNVHRMIAGVRRALAPHRTGRIALVPTMGALHSGHTALFDAGRAASERLVATIFVNPTQFNSQADLALYPRHEARDLEIAAAHGVDDVFIPSVDEMYPEGFGTWVEVDQGGVGLEDAHRPGHFRGVATVCLKLFTIIQPTAAFFGQKDAQQVAVIRQLVRDLNLPLEIRVVPTVRDTDGLALSSRNARLSADERQTALAVPRALAAGLDAHRRGDDPVAAATAVLASAPGLIVEYVAVADFAGRPSLAIAARAGATRLIDNAPLDGSDAGNALAIATPLASVKGHS